MASLGMNFDANQVEPNGTFDPVPAGDYVLQIINSEMKSTKDGMGQYLSLEMDILEGEYAGRKVFDRLNLMNNNVQTVEIAQRTLSAICHATGVLNVADSEQLHFKPMVAKVVVKPPKDQYAASNEVKGYRPMNGSAPAVAHQQRPAGGGYQQQPQNHQQQRPAQQSAAATGGATGNTPPWRRK